MKRAAVKKTAVKKATKGSAAKVAKKKVAIKKVAKKAVKKAVKKTAAEATRATPSRSKAKAVVAKTAGTKRKVATAKTAAKKTSVKKAVKKSAVKKASSKPLRKLATKSSAKSAASKAMTKVKAASAKKPAARPAVVKKLPVVKTAKTKISIVDSPTRKAIVPQARKAVSSIDQARLAVRNPKAAPPRDSSASGPVSPEVATAHFQELLRAKQERVRQGPTYPAANPFTGRHDGSEGHGHGDLDSHGPPQLPNTPEPEAVYGASTAHGRGNQGMRKPK